MSSRLPETDLANWSFLPPAEKRFALEMHERPKRIIGSYEPFRRVFPDAVNQQYPLFGETLPASAWEGLECRLIQECKGDADKIRMNKQILAATHQFADERGISANALDVVPLRFAGGVAYQFGMSLLVRYPQRSTVAFLDMRRTNRLKPNGMQFVFSALHHRFRAAYADLAQVDLEIWRYGTTTSRRLVPVSLTGAIIEWDLLAADVRETHHIWEEVKSGGRDDRRAAGGSAGPLFE